VALLYRNFLSTSDNPHWISIYEYEDSPHFVVTAYPTKSGSIYGAKRNETVVAERDSWSELLDTVFWYNMGHPVTVRDFLRGEQFFMPTQRVLNDGTSYVAEYQGDDRFTQRGWLDEYKQKGIISAPSFESPYVWATYDPAKKEVMFYASGNPISPSEFVAAPHISGLTGNRTNRIYQALQMLHNLRDQLKTALYYKEVSPFTDKLQQRIKNSRSGKVQSTLYNKIKQMRDYGIYDNPAVTQAVTAKKLDRLSQGKDLSRLFAQAEEEPEPEEETDAWEDQ